MANKVLTKVEETKFNLESSPEQDSFTFIDVPPKSTQELLTNFIRGNITPIKELIIDLTVIDSEIGYAHQRFRKAEARLNKKSDKTFTEIRAAYLAKGKIPQKSFFSTEKHNLFIEAYTEYTCLEFLETLKNSVEHKDINEISAKELLKKYFYIRENSRNKLADYRSLIDINLAIEE